MCCTALDGLRSPKEMSSTSFFFDDEDEEMTTVILGDAVAPFSSWLSRTSALRPSGRLRCGRCVHLGCLLGASRCLLTCHFHICDMEHGGQCIVRPKAQPDFVFGQFISYHLRWETSVTVQCAPFPLAIARGHWCKAATCARLLHLRFGRRGGRGFGGVWGTDAAPGAILSHSESFCAHEGGQMEAPCHARWRLGRLAA